MKTYGLKAVKIKLVLIIYIPVLLIKLKTYCQDNTAEPVEEKPGFFCLLQSISNFMRKANYRFFITVE